MGTFPGFTHVAVTVSDLSTSVPWYTRLLGSEPVLDEDTGPFRHVVYVIGEGVLFGLHEFPDPNRSGNFDPRRPGLDHVAFACADRGELEKWQDRLNELGITHGGIIDVRFGRVWCA